MMTSDYSYSPEYNNVHQLKVYQKAISVFKLSRALAAFISDNKSVLAMHRSKNKTDRYAINLVMDAMSLAPKIALVTTSYSKKIKKRRLKALKQISNKLNTYCDYLEQNYQQSKEYIAVLRKEISDFSKERSYWENSL